MAGTGSSTSPNQNPSYVTNDGKASTFGRNLIQYIQNRLPYASTGQPESDILNPKYKFFQKTGMKRAEALAKAVNGDISKEQALVAARTELKNG